MNMVGTRIKKRRIELGLTQTQIKDFTGISSGNMSDIENGNKLPSAATLILLSDILKCSIDWILTGRSLNGENFIFTDERCQNLLNMFQELNEDQKQDVLDYIEYKKCKSTQVKSDSSKSSLSSQESNNSKMA